MPELDDEEEKQYISTLERRLRANTDSNIRIPTYDDVALIRTRFDTNNQVNSEKKEFVKEFSQKQKC